jgi:hypothetical protein
MQDHADAEFDPRSQITSKEQESKEAKFRLARSTYYDLGAAIDACLQQAH